MLLYPFEERVISVSFILRYILEISFKRFSKVLVFHFRNPSINTLENK